MDPKPFIKLPADRKVNRSDLPADLVHFYTSNEGRGLESSPERTIRLCLLEEVQRVGWKDLRTFGSEMFERWQDFQGMRVGISSFFDEILYVQKAPSCGAGAILALGMDMAGPGGIGPYALEPSLVLGASFDSWLANLEMNKWVEYGFVPGSISELSKQRQNQVRQYYKALNPETRWS